MGVTGQTQRFSRIHSATFLVIAVPSSSDCCAQTVEQCPSALCSSAILVAEQPSPVTTMRHCCPRAGSPGRAAARRPAASWRRWSGALPPQLSSWQLWERGAKTCSRSRRGVSAACGMWILCLLLLLFGTCSSETTSLLDCFGPIFGSRYRL